MDDNARLHLQKMIKANNVEDQTEMIRDLKHSDILRKDIQTLLSLKEKFGNDSEKLNLECMYECSFLFNYYTYIYNKIRKDEISLSILYKFLDILKQIENKEVDQHEGSFIVGTLLKELYIDSALKKADKLDKQHLDSLSTDLPLNEPLLLSWKEFKIMGKNVN